MPVRRPAVSVIRTVSAVSWPGVTMTAAQTATNDAASLSISMMSGQGVGSAAASRRALAVPSRGTQPGWATAMLSGALMRRMVARGLDT